MVSARRLLCWILCWILWPATPLVAEEGKPSLKLPTGTPNDAPVTVALLGDAFSSEPPELIEDARGIEPTRYRDASKLWVWSEATAPRLVDPRSFDSREIEEDSERLRITLVRRDEEKERDKKNEEAEAETFWVIAAPVDAWEALPETWLPAWEARLGDSIEVPHRPGERWRVRLVGRDKGSWWTDVAPGRGSVALEPVAAPTPILRVVDADGNPLAEAEALLLAGAPGRSSGQPKLARFRGDGEIRFDTLPSFREVTAVVEAPGHAPALFRGDVRDLDGMVRLEAGAEVLGRVVDGKGDALANAEALLEAFASDDAPHVLRRATRSDEKGRFRLAGLPVGDAVLRVDAPGFAAERRRLELEPAPLDTGVWTLGPATSATVVVVDPDEVPIVGATLRVDGELVATTGGDGTARVDSLSPRGGDSASVDAPGFLEESVRLSPPFDRPKRVVLERSYEVSGRFLHADDAPVQRGEAVVEIGSQTRTSELETDGSFRLDLPPETDITLELRSPESASLRVGDLRGTAGETRDLGDLRAPDGLVARGRIVRADDGSPVAGARVWTPRASDQGPLLAWMRDDLLEARSDAEGRFVLRGLGHAPSILRVDAAGLARGHASVRPEPDERAIELGRLELSEGATVRFEVDDPEARVAEIDLRGERLALDRTTVAVREGVATFRHVPPGRATAAALVDGRVVCEEAIEIDEGERFVDAACRGSAVRVSGKVLFGAYPAESGRLSWQTTDGAAVPAGIQRFQRPGGLNQTHVFTTQQRGPDTEVRPDGTFEVELRPGRWKVTYFGGGASMSETREVEIPEAETFELALNFPAGAVRGRVVDSEGRPVDKVRVAEQTSGIVTFTDADGRFVFRGLEPGARRIQARQGDSRSQSVEIEVTPGEEVDDLELQLGADSPGEVTVQALDREGHPAAGAFVFVETDTQPLRMATTDTEGRAGLRFDEPLPTKVRAASFASGTWALGAWTAFEEAAAGIVLEAPESASLEIFSVDRSGAVQIRTGDGWDLSHLLGFLGQVPTLRASEPLLLHGLPPGSYTVSLADQQVVRHLSAGDRARIEID